MKNAGIVLLLICSPLSLASADVVGTLNVHTAADGHRTTGWDSGQPVEVQVDFSRTQDGTYDVTVWSGERQLAKVTRVDVQAGKATQRGESYRTDPITVSCPATDLKQNGPTSFQVFVQAVFDNGQKGGRVLIAEVDWQLGSVEDNQPGKRVNLGKSFVQPEAILTVTQQVLFCLRISANKSGGLRSVVAILLSLVAMRHLPAKLVT